MSSCPSVIHTKERVSQLSLYQIISRPVSWEMRRSNHLSEGMYSSFPSVHPYNKSQPADMVIISCLKFGY